MSMRTSSCFRSVARPDRLAPTLALLACAVVAGCGSSRAPSTSSDAGAGGAGGVASSPASSSSGVSSSTGGADAATGDPDAGVSNPGLPRSITATNGCTFPVWADALPKTTFPGGAPVKLDPGQSFVAGVDNGWSGRVWGRFDCATDGTGKFQCADDPFPSTLAELTLTS
jgi:hypothetical protein